MTGVGKQAAVPPTSNQQAAATPMSQRGPRMFGFGAGTSVGPGKALEKMSEPDQKMSELDQVMQDIATNATSVDDISDVEALLAKVEAKDAAAAGRTVTAPKENKSAQVSLGADQLAAAKFRVQQTRIDSDGATPIPSKDG